MGTGGIGFENPAEAGYWASTPRQNRVLGTGMHLGL